MTLVVKVVCGGFLNRALCSWRTWWSIKGTG
nr:hypothetical protein [Vibrio parahaemolyticus]